MHHTKKLFKSKLMWCQDRQDQFKMYKLVLFHRIKIFKDFWNATTQMNIKSGLPVSVECPIASGGSDGPLSWNSVPGPSKADFIPLKILKWPLIIWRKVNRLVTSRLSLVVKNKTGDLSDKTNYRPISLATTTAKILDRLLDFIKTPNDTWRPIPIQSGPLDW